MVLDSSPTLQAGPQQRTGGTQTRKNNLYRLLEPSGSLVARLRGFWCAPLFTCELLSETGCLRPLCSIASGATALPPSLRGLSAVRITATVKQVATTVRARPHYCRWCPLRRPAPAARVPEASAQRRLQGVTQGWQRHTWGASKSPLGKMTCRGVRPRGQNLAALGAAPGCAAACALRRHLGMRV